MSNSLNNIAWLKLIKNKSSLFSLVFIFLCVFMSFFSYLFIPDKTPFANQMHLELTTLPPFSEVTFLQIPSQINNSESFFEYFFKGKKSIFEKIPIQSYEKYSDGINYTVLGSYMKSNFEGKYEIINQTFWFGTDRFGRDLLSRIIYGVRISLAVGFNCCFYIIINWYNIRFISWFL